MQRIIVLIIGIVCNVASIILGIMGCRYYSYSQGTALLVSNTNAVNTIKNYPLFLELAGAAALLGIILMIVYNIMLFVARSKKNKIGANIDNDNPFGQ